MTTRLSMSLDSKACRLILRLESTLSCRSWSIINSVTMCFRKPLVRSKMSYSKTRSWWQSKVFSHPWCSSSMVKKCFRSCSRHTPTTLVHHQALTVVTPCLKAAASRAHIIATIPTTAVSSLNLTTKTKVRCSTLSNRSKEWIQVIINTSRKCRWDRTATHRHSDQQMETVEAIMLNTPSRTTHSTQIRSSRTKEIKV